MRKDSRGKRRTLEKRMNTAMRMGDFALAESLGNRLWPSIPDVVRRWFQPKARECLVCSATITHPQPFCCPDHCRAWALANPLNGRRPELANSRGLSWLLAHRLEGGKFDWENLPDWGRA